MIDIVTIPPGLTGPVARMAGLRLAPPTGSGRKGEEVAVVAGPLPDPAGGTGRFAVWRLRGDEVVPLWTTVRGSAPVRRADLLPLGGGKAVMLLPRRALVLLEPFAAEPRDRARLVARGASLPMRIFATGQAGEAPVAVTLRADGTTLFDRLGPDGAVVAGARESGPELAPGQVPSLLVRDGSGRLVLGADDAVRGFQLWRAEAEGWRHLVRDGAARFGQNAALLDGVLWNGGLVLAAGPAEEMRESLHGLPIRGELVGLDAEGRPGLIAGELRPSPAGLLVPRMGPRAMLDLAAESFVRLAAGPGPLLAAILRDGETALCRITEDGTGGEVLGSLPGEVLEMSCDAKGGLRALVAAPPEEADWADLAAEDDDEEPDDADWAAFAKAIG